MFAGMDPSGCRVEVPQVVERHLAVRHQSLELQMVGKALTDSSAMRHLSLPRKG